MNTGFYEDLDTNFEQALLLANKTFSHKELVDMLKCGNIPQKQIASLKFDYVKTKDDAGSLINNLTGCDGKIREAAALTINRLIKESEEAADLFCSYPKIFADATIDINANICRLNVESACILKYDNDFAIKYSEAIISFISEAFKELDSFVFRDKKYVINKQLFKLYWCLETLKNYYDIIRPDILSDILTKASGVQEYTIREKTAEIVCRSDKFPNLKEKLMNDENYYVKAVFLNH